MEKSKRIIYLDMLKILSCIFVVLIHVTAPGFHDIKLRSLSWNVNLFFNMLGRFAVPVFIMVSGALFLDNEKEIDIKKLWKKNILRLVIIYIVWTLIYSIYALYNGSETINFISIIKKSIRSSYYHLWFLPMIIAIYVIIPLLKPFTKNKKLIEYFLLIFFFLKIIPYTLDLFKVSYIAQIVKRIDVPLLSYTGYFILGHYLNKYEIEKKKRIIIYIIGIISFIISVVGTSLFSIYMKKATETFARELSLTSFFLSVFVFVFIKYKYQNKEISERIKKIIIHLSKHTLGVYLIHPLFRDIIKNQMNISFNRLTNLPIIFAIMLLISYIISYILSKIPKINKYLV